MALQTATDMLVVSDVSKRFGRIQALSNVSFSLPRGTVLGLLGANGAGKTTLMRLIAGFMAPSRGRIEIDGRDLLEDPLGARRHLGYMPENVPLYGDMRVQEYLRFRGRLKGFKGRALKRRLHDVMRRCGVDAVGDVLIRRISRGFRQRVGLADALLNDPDLLVLDEPLANLDPAQRRQMLGLIHGLRGRHAVLMSSHILSEVESVCAQVVILERGRMLAQGPAGELLPPADRKATIEMEFQPRDGTLPGRETFADRLQVPADRLVLEPLDAGWFRLQCEICDADTARAVLAGWVSDAGATLRELHARPARLEDVYTVLTERGRQNAGEDGRTG